MSDTYESEISATITSCGVLCFSIEPNSKDIYFLLGKEKFVSEWRYGSGKWSEFSGQLQPGESVESCATREFLEETLGLVRFCDESDQDFADTKGRANRIVQSLKDQRYTFVIRTRYHYFIGDDPHVFERIIYVKSVFWDPCVADSFYQLRHQLKLLHNRPAHLLDPKLWDRVSRHSCVSLDVCSQRYSVHNDFLEKQQLQWWSIPWLVQLLNKRKGESHIHKLNDRMQEIQEMQDNRSITQQQQQQHQREEQEQEPSECEMQEICLDQNKPHGTRIYNFKQASLDGLEILFEKINQVFPDQLVNNYSDFGGHDSLTRKRLRIMKTNSMNKNIRHFPDIQSARSQREKWWR